MNVTIEYCVPCGHLDRAIEVQRDLLARYGRNLGAVTLQPGAEGVFKVSVNGQLVLDAQQDGFDPPGSPPRSNASSRRSTSLPVRQMLPH